MNRVTENMKNATMMMVTGAKNAVAKKDHGGKEVIVELGLAAIAVALLLVYRTEINTLVTGIMTQATTSIGNLFTI
jgi:hypothetical protein